MHAQSLSKSLNECTASEIIADELPRTPATPFLREVSCIDFAFAVHYAKSYVRAGADPGNLLSAYIHVFERALVGVAMSSVPWP